MRRIFPVSLLLMVMTVGAAAFGQDPLEVQIAVLWEKGPKRSLAKDLAAKAERSGESLRILEARPNGKSEGAFLLVEQGRADAPVREGASAFPWPSKESLSKRAKGVRRLRLRALGSPSDVLLLTVVAPRSDARAALEAAAKLAYEAARQYRGTIYCPGTSRLFGTSAWKKARVLSWLEGLADARRWVRIEQSLGKPKSFQTTGLRSFGHPEISCAIASSADRKRLEALVLLSAQTLVERSSPLPQTTKNLMLDVDGIEHLEVQKQLRDVLGRHAQRKARVQIKLAPRNGRPWIELQFPEVGSANLVEAQRSLLKVVFGDPKDSPGRATPREKERAAKIAARKKLIKEVKPHFRSGIPDGDTLLIKAKFRTRKNTHESMWVEVTSWDVSRITGTLRNQPRDVPGVTKGDKIEIKEASLEGFEWHRADGRVIKGG